MHLLHWKDVPVSCLPWRSNSCGGPEAGLSSSQQRLAQKHGLLVRLKQICRSLIANSNIEGLPRHELSPE